QRGKRVLLLSSLISRKPFDNVNWDFLKSRLHDFGFPNFSLLWNGNKLPSFKPTYDLRQGDHLSPYLFILCMEKLSISINNAVHQGTWDPIHISNTGPCLSHLLFADDVLLFTKAKNSQIRFITNLFDHFSLASGLKINLSKSRAFYSSGIPQAKINKLTSLSGIRSTVSLDKYLDFPILKGRAKRSDFNFIIDKMQSRVASWKNRLLNKLGRLVVASSVLSSIPTYYMQIAWFPQS
ncbi:RNA-directed DNA polymerase (Reverse transcriptase), partial [Trifolium medium]|nr:RNA-directed DNA polymerase (Reverse transcriptase) [Trifolium medium]